MRHTGRPEYQSQNSFQRGQLSDTGTGITKMKKQESNGGKTPRRRTKGKKRLQPDGTKRTGPHTLAGDDEAIQFVKTRALELYAIHGKSQREIPQLLVREFPSLKRAPCQKTVCFWIKDATLGQRTKQEVQQEFLERTHLQFRSLQAKWMPIAMADSLDIQRTRIKDGERVTYIDEDSTKEQIEATKLVAKLFELEGKFIGVTEQTKATDQPSVTLNALIINATVDAFQKDRPKQLGSLLIESGDPLYAEVE